MNTAVLNFLQRIKEHLETTSQFPATAHIEVSSNEAKLTVCSKTRVIDTFTLCFENEELVKVTIHGMNVIGHYMAINRRKSIWGLDADLVLFHDNSVEVRLIPTTLSEWL